MFFFKAAAEGIGNADYKLATSIYDFTVTDIDGNQVSLEKYRYFQTLLLVYNRNDCHIN
jgi:glutathione peroxidase-family protein